MEYFHEFEENTLIKLIAHRVLNNELVRAQETSKEEGPFYCPETYEELIVRKCIEKRDHFAYKSRLSPTGGKESDLHKQCKKEICSILNSEYPEGNWQMERPLRADDRKGFKKVIPDISGRINRRGIIIEVQASFLSLKKILHRINQYTSRGGYMLWIVPLEAHLGRKPFRPRLFERFLHTLYYGRVYYWYRGNGTYLSPVHFAVAERYIEERSWYDPGGIFRSEGDYYLPFKRTKQPVHGTNVDLLNFILENRDDFDIDNEKLSIPSCRIFRDSLKPWWT